MATGGMATAWGRRNGSASSAVAPGPGKRTKQCFICFDEPAHDLFVVFLPCKHYACLDCMEDLRKEAIRKVRHYRL